MKRINLIYFLILLTYTPPVAALATSNTFYIEKQRTEVASTQNAPIKTPPQPAIPAIMVKIAICESGNSHFESDGVTVKLGRQNPQDVGRFQINLYYHQARAESMGLDLFDEQDNTTYALWLYEHQGTAPWVWSKGCWSK